MGMSRSGKTEAIRSMVQRRVDAGERVLVVTPDAVFDGREWLVRPVRGEPALDRWADDGGRAP